MAIQEKYKMGTIILMEKGISRQMYMVTSGSVGLYMNYGKKDEYLIGLCNKGTVFGEMGILCHKESIYTAVAETDVTAVTFSEHELDEFVREYPEKTIGIMKSTARINSILSLNLKMMVEDSKQEEMILKSLSEALKTSESDDNDYEEIEDDHNKGKWQYFGSEHNNL